MRGQSCPPHYRLLRAAPCSWKPLYSPLSYSKSPIRLRSAPFPLPAFSPSAPFPSSSTPVPAACLRFLNPESAEKNSWTTLDRKQQFLLRWMSGETGPDGHEGYDSPSKERVARSLIYLSFSSGNFRSGWKDYWSEGLWRRFKGEFSGNARNETKIFRHKDSRDSLIKAWWLIV